MLLVYNIPMANIFGGLKQKILLLFFLNEEKKFYVREVSSMIGCSPMGAQKELKKLEEETILSSEIKGRLKLFSLKRDSAIYAELKGLILKSYGLVSLLKQYLEKVEGIEKAFIYGSFAKGEADAFSDIDLFIIGEVDYKTLNQTILSFEKKFGREINVELMNPKEIEERLNDNDPYITDIWKSSKIPVI